MSLTTQFYTMLAMIGMGSYFGAALDTYSRFLKRPFRKSWVVFINDILFWFAQALLIFYVLYLVNNGEIRFYIFLALLCGFAAYQSLLKTAYNNSLEHIISFVIKFYEVVKSIFINIVYKPIFLLITFLISVLVVLFNFILRLLQIIWKMIYSILRFICSPFVLLVKFIWNHVPKSFKIRTGSIFKTISNYISKLVHFIKRK